MAKFFFDKDPNNHRISQGQVLGIVWLSMGLLMILGTVFFCHRNENETSLNDSVVGEKRVELQEKEDSSYRVRYRPRVRAECREDVAKVQDTVNMRQVSTPMRRQPLMIELNTADTTTLMLLHGIGPTFAKRIVNYRNRLGGFVDKSQLIEVYGLSPELVEHIAPFVYVDASQVRQLSINEIGLKQLIKHPYVEYYQARDIIQLRQRGVHFNSIDDLRAVPSMADSTLRRLYPYIDFGRHEGTEMEGEE